jgi:2-dehydro-3-deoxygluconokinase
MSGARGFEVVTLGETMVMVTPEEREPLASATRFALETGGAESNVALYLQELGHTTAWASRLGDDPLGHRIHATLTAHEVDTSCVTFDTGSPTGLYVKDPGLEHTRVYYYRRGSAASQMGPDLIPTLPLAQARVVHLTGITPGLSASCAALVDALVEVVSGLDALLSFDVNHRHGVWPPEVAGPVLARIADRADIVLVGQDEAEVLWQTSSPEALRDLLPRPARLVVKDGAVGATELQRAPGAGAVGDGRTFVPAPRVDVVESVGAGDAFAAGYLHGVLTGLDSESSLAEGHRLAARALGTTGDYRREEAGHG